MKAPNDQDADLTFRTFSGMSIPLDIDTHPNIRTRAAEILRARRTQDCEIAVLEAGRQWEIITPENRDGICISDNDGYLLLKPIQIAEPEEENE